MGGLASDSQRVSDLLPGPTGRARGPYLVGLDALGQPVQGHGCTQPPTRISGSDGGADPFHVHAVSLD